jgi:sigma54-dependent transcription regulator
VKNQPDWKSWRPAYCLCSLESSAADILLEWLKSSRSDPRRCVVSLMQSPSEETAQAALLL